MSLYEKDPRVRPAAIEAYPKRRPPVPALPPMRSVRPPEPAYADFFEGEHAALASASAVATR